MSSRKLRARGVAGSGFNEDTSAQPAVGTHPSALPPDSEGAEQLGERLRQIALGATAALLSARAYWVSEPDLRADAGTGMTWVAVLLLVTGLALASALISGKLRLRWSWADAGVIALMILVGMSASHAIDRRPAINLAWEWGGLGFTYLLLRNLPRTRNESKALAASLVATAVAIAIYGVYQVGVELPEFRTSYLANRQAVLEANGIVSGTPSEALFENRLLGSNEPFSTFALPNSLAGFLVGPLVLMLGSFWNVLIGRDPKYSVASRLSTIAFALPVVLAVLICLILTKSRCAYLGLITAAIVMALQYKNIVPRRTLLISALGFLSLVGLLVAAGYATGRLDKEVLTQSGKSIGYRWQYWTGAWTIIRSNPQTFWSGLGPGNFVAPYVKIKPPEASEEIFDPHNDFLEVWSTGGLFALVAFLLAIGIGLWSILFPGALPGPSDPTEPRSEKRKTYDPTAPPKSAAWLLVWGGLGGWLGVILLGQLNPFADDLFSRWLVLGAGWVLAVLTGTAIWRRPEALTPPLIGAALVALLVNLLGAGGIGIPVVAGALWGLLALGLNLQENRKCSVQHEVGGRLGAFACASIWVACLGIFVGAVGPYFQAEAALEAGQDALRATPPNYERAAASFERAFERDQYSARPWFALAGLDSLVWNNRGSKAADLRWKKILVNMIKGVESPRPTNSWTRHRERARTASLLLKQLGGSITPVETTILRGKVVEASRTAALLYPNNASLRAWLAEASSEIGMPGESIKEGRFALKLDQLTPHLDKKLDPKIKIWLESKIPEWEKQASEIDAIAEPDTKRIPKP